MLRTDAVTLRYPGRTLVENLSADFRRSEVWGVLGRNGSGKSTLLHALAALTTPQSGTVTMDGKPMASQARRAAARRLGTLLQEESREFWGSTRDYVLLGRYPHARSALGWGRDDELIADAEMRALHLEDLAARPYVSLSGGERQRARLAALFAQRPGIYLLDEPLQHHDRPHQVAVLERLAHEARQNAAVVVMVLHDLLFAARYCTRLLLLSGDGRFRMGAASEVMNADNLGELYGFPLVAVDAGGERLFLPGQRSATSPDV
jgi:iron complex transport system ATP-binding protein